jgi:NAD-dependent dihydropyrimidine dehydrogenase PreA subunit
MNNLNYCCAELQQAVDSGDVTYDGYGSLYVMIDGKQGHFIVFANCPRCGHKLDDLIPKKTQEELDILRAAHLNGEGIDPDTKFTCDDCASRCDCAFAFDLYNTDGDCLASK